MPSFCQIFGRFCINKKSEQCCYCFSLRVGTLIIASLFIIGSGLLVLDDAIYFTNGHCLRLKLWQLIKREVYQRCTLAKCSTFYWFNREDNLDNINYDGRNGDSATTFETSTDFQIVLLMANVVECLLSLMVFLEASLGRRDKKRSVLGLWIIYNTLAFIVLILMTGAIFILMLANGVPDDLVIISLAACVAIILFYSFSIAVMKSEYDCVWKEDPSPDFSPVEMHYIIHDEEKRKSLPPPSYDASFQMEVPPPSYASLPNYVHVPRKANKNIQP